MDPKPEYRILVLQRGWVVVGQFELVDDECRLHNAAVIRRWGTSKGIGELVTGPTKITVLDKAGEIRADKLAVVLHISVDSEAWSKALQ